MERSRKSSGPRAWARAAFALDLRSLAAHRIALGVILVADCLLRCRDFRLMHCADGMFAPEAVAEFFGSPACWSLASASQADGWAAAVLTLEGLAGLLLACGFRTRVATVLGWVALVSVVRRTAPATNAGDSWLICQLFWACFLPLGARWSIDARRAAGGSPPSGPVPSHAWSMATAAVVLQTCFVYLGAGLGKCNATWWSGAALGHALSLHDHGSVWGAAVATGGDWLLQPLSRLVPAAEISLALLLVIWPSSRVRGILVVVGILFHVAIWSTMSVGLFAPIAIAAWLPLVPTGWWAALCRAPREPLSASEASAVRPVGLPGPAAVCCGAALALAGAGFAVVTARPVAPLPAWLDTPLDLAALHQDWEMFGDVPPQEQWVVGRAELVSGRVVDLLRGDAAVGDGPPPGGFTTLPHHRWHKLLWVLHEPRMRVFAPGVAAALVRRWNETHPPGERVRALEVRFTRRPSGSTSAHDERLIASWPPRSATGAGGLDRFLEAVERAGQDADAVGAER